VRVRGGGEKSEAKKVHQKHSYQSFLCLAVQARNDGSPETDHRQRTLTRPRAQSGKGERYDDECRESREMCERSPVAYQSVYLYTHGYARAQAHTDTATGHGDRHRGQAQGTGTRHPDAPRSRDPLCVCVRVRACGRVDADMCV
jgi:hypothetical protein